MIQRAVSLPLELQELEGKVNYIVQTGNYTYTSSCPECGGNPHPNGDFPDRFNIFLHSKTTGGPLGWCRRCGWTWVPGKGKGKEYRPDPELQARWKAEREAIEQKRLSAIEHALWLLDHEKPWITYHNALTDEVRALYAKRGIRDDYWLEYWQLGYCQSFTVNYMQGETWQSYVTDSLTIPAIETGGRVVGLRHRLLHAQRSQDRYRPGMKGLPASVFLCDYDRELQGPALIVEGEFKSMVTYLELEDPGLHVVGIPGKTPGPELLAKFAKCDPVYLLLDPDAYELTPAEKKSGHSKSAVQRMTEDLGQERVRWIRVPDKVDDMILAGALKKCGLRALVKGARKAW